MDYKPTLIATLIAVSEVVRYDGVPIVITHVADVVRSWETLCGVKIDPHTSLRSHFARPDCWACLLAIEEELI